jgi:hypothetical protein
LPAHDAVSWPALVLPGSTVDAESTSVLASLGSPAPLAVWSPVSSPDLVLQWCAASQKHAAYFARAANYLVLLVSDFRPVYSLPTSAVPESPLTLEHSDSAELPSGRLAMFPFV